MVSGDAEPASRLDAEILAAEVAERLEEVLPQASMAEWIGVKLNRQLLAFLTAEVLPQANRAAEMSVDPTPLFAVVVRVLRTYADALECRPSADSNKMTKRTRSARAACLRFTIDMLRRLPLRPWKTETVNCARKQKSTMGHFQGDRLPCRLPTSRDHPRRRNDWRQFSPLG
jgi:hypothetical protein